MTNSLQAVSGLPYPLGASCRDGGVNFAVFSRHATKVDLCLFDQPEGPETARIPLPERSGDIWHGFIPGLNPGQLYGFRVEGPYAPAQGHRFNPAKLLLDPHARAIAGKVEWNDALYAYPVGGKEDVADERDSAPFVPKSVIVGGESFDWQETRPPRRPWSETVVYEVHVKGFSQQWEAVPAEVRGTYAALGSPEAIAYFQKLGVTAIELLPVQQKIAEAHVAARGLANYWGYNTIGYFAPEASYAGGDDRGGQVAEFREMVRNLHRAGLEVILDVVYNHTAEGGGQGPSFCFRGLDNTIYYRVDPADPRQNIDFTGCGNSLNIPLAPVLRLVLESLRYWVTEMGVDGFRFDLAPTLAREYDSVSQISAFLAAIHQDPVLSRVKLIAEPWDIGPDGYQVGHFPWPWAEWNGKYRDELRSFWKGDPLSQRQVAARLAGSSDLYGAESRGPLASVNFLVAHDGFTLNDLVSYNEKHNEANGEENRDGDSSPSSWNCGAEGVTDDAEINRLRRRQRRNFLATLLLSQGVPMLCGGDEFGRTQQGNNNAYCQDGPISWFDWKQAAEGEGLAAFVARLIAFRRENPIFRAAKFLGGENLYWVDSAGQSMVDEEWGQTEERGFGMVLKEGDRAFCLYLHAHGEPCEWTLPEGAWELLLDTNEEDGFLSQPKRLEGGTAVKMEGRSLLLLRRAG